MDSSTAHPVQLSRNHVSSGTAIGAEAPTLIEGVTQLCERVTRGGRKRASRCSAGAGGRHRLGNVWEACNGWFMKEHQRRPVRGGSYFNTPAFCRAASREGYSGGRYVGFRLFAGPSAPFQTTPAIDEVDLEGRKRPPSIYEALGKNDFQLASELVEKDPDAVEMYDEIPPPLHWCIYNDMPDQARWLLDHGAEIERLDQDYGATPLTCAIVMRNLAIIDILISRGASTIGALQTAEKGLSGGYENVGFDRSEYKAIVERLRQLDVT